MPNIKTLTDDQMPDATRTKDRLTKVLITAGLLGLAGKAAMGYYDDFESPLDTPITNLVNDLRTAGREDLAQRAIDGEWDSTKEEADVWFRSHAAGGLDESLGGSYGKR